MNTMTIVCRLPPQPEDPLCVRMPGLEDVRVLVNGYPLDNVGAVRIEALPNEPVRAWVEFFSVELQVEALDERAELLARVEMLEAALARAEASASDRLPR